MGDTRAKRLVCGGDMLELGQVVDGQYLRRVGGTITSGNPGGGGAWGGITGSLAAQADLQSALDAKAENDHNHDGAYATADHNHDSDYAAADHTHPGGGSALDAWPVGSVYIAVDNTSPATRFGGGTWAAFGAGRMMVGFSAGDTDFDTAEETGGAKTVTLTAAQSGLPQHTHLQNAHTHTQNAHTHTQDAHSHTIPVGATDDTSAPFDRADAGSNTGGANATTATGTAVAVNQNATAVNQDATAVNQNAGPAAAAEAHTNMPPYIVVYMWKRTA